MTSSRQALEAEISNSSNTWDPQDEEYIVNVVDRGLGIFIVGGIIVAIILAYFAGRLACCALRAKVGCCPRRGSPPARHILVLRVCLGALLLVPLIAAVVLAAAAAPMGDAVKDTTETVIEQVDLLAGKVNRTLNSVRAAVPRGRSFSDIGVDISPLTSARADLAKARRDVEEVKEDVDWIAGVLVSCVVVTAVAGVLAATAALLFLAWPHALPALFIFFALGLVALLCGYAVGGFGTVMKQGSADACNSMQLHLDGERSVWALTTLPCDELTRIDRGIDAVMRALARTVRVANNQIDEINGNSVLLPNAPPPLPRLCVPYDRPQGTDSWQQNSSQQPGCVPLRVGAVTAAYNASVCEGYELPPNTEPISDPAYQFCFFSGAPVPENYYERLVRAAGNLEELDTALPTVRSIARCGFIDTAFEAIVRQDCGPIDDSMRRLRASALTMSVALTFAFLAFILSTKWLRPYRPKGNIAKASSYGSSLEQAAGTAAHEDSVTLPGPVGHGAGDEADARAHTLVNGSHAASATRQTKPAVPGRSSSAGSADVVNAPSATRGPSQQAGAGAVAGIVAGCRGLGNKVQQFVPWAKGKSARVLQQCASRGVSSSEDGNASDCSCSERNGSYLVAIPAVSDSSKAEDRSVVH